MRKMFLLLQAKGFNRMRTAWEKIFCFFKQKIENDIMEREMTLHQAKMNLLRVVDRIKTVDEVQAIQKILANYYAQKVNEEMDRLWDNGTINEQIIEQWGQEHMRTPYRYAQ